MAKSMNASVTDGQINDMVAKFRAAMQKHCTEIDSLTFQKVQGVSNIGVELFAVLRDHAEKFSKQIVRLVENINHTIAPTDAVKETGRNLYGNINHAEHLPQSEGDSERMTFIPLEKDMSPDEVDALVADGGWRYTSFNGLCKHNQGNPDFTKSIPHFIQGKDKEGRHCYAAFYHWDDERNVSVDRNEGGWGDGWSVAVVPASPEDLGT